MPKKELTLTGHVLMAIMAADYLMTPLLNPYARHKSLFKTYKSYSDLIYRLEKLGWVKVFKEKENKFIKLTKKGQLEALLAKAKLPVPKIWDGKWRLFVFDIPEDNAQQRHLLRNLLRKNGYYKLQASVYINPYPLNREAIEYLKESGLMDYIRIIKAEEIDDDKDLRKKFGLV